MLLGLGLGLGLAFQLALGLALGLGLCLERQYRAVEPPRSQELPRRLRLFTVRVMVRCFVVRARVRVGIRVRCFVVRKAALRKEEVEELHLSCG